MILEHMCEQGAGEVEEQHEMLEERAGNRRCMGEQIIIISAAS